MAKRDVVVVGASAGGVDALRALVGALPSTLPATVLVVLHLPSQARSALPAILSRSGRLPARHPADGDSLATATILVGPPDHHLTVEDGSVRLTHGPRENGHRPAVDPLFRSAARWYGPRVIAVQLSGTLDDGASGAVTVSRFGGLVLVQDPKEALYAGMPESVLASAPVHACASAAELGRLISMLVEEEVEVTAAPEPSDGLKEEVVGVDPQRRPEPELIGDPAGLGCVACGGSLYEVRDDDLLRYRCRIGHAWSPESLLAEQSQALESALWMALRTLEDRAALCERSHQAAQDSGLTRNSERFAELARDARSAATVMRRALEDAQRVVLDERSAVDLTVDRAAG